MRLKLIKFSSDQILNIIESNITSRNIYSRHEYQHVPKLVSNFQALLDPSHYDYYYYCC